MLTIKETPEVTRVERKNMGEYWMIWCYNELDADFGYDCGAQPFMNGLDKATAKSIARHKIKTTPDFCGYYAQEEPQRWV